MAYYLNKTRLVVGQAFTDNNGVQYPANWLELASSEDLAAVGIKEVEQKVLPKKKTVAPPKQSLDDTYVKDKKRRIVKDAEGNKIINKGMRTKVLEKEQRDLVDVLKSTDHYIIRKYETGEKVPSQVQEYRDKARAIYKERVGLIMDCNSVEELRALMSGELANLKYKQNLDVIMN